MSSTENGADANAPDALPPITMDGETVNVQALFAAEAPPEVEAQTIPSHAPASEAETTANAAQPNTATVVRPAPSPSPNAALA